MGRFAQAIGERGSLKWLQKAVNERPDVLDGWILPRLKGSTSLEWLSPLASDDFAEYRDRAFLERLDLTEAGSALSAFWPERGPQWDALARSDAGDILLIEAKAHIAELCSPGTQSSPASRPQIERALAETVQALGADPLAPWSTTFYQLANRIAHLHFLRGMLGRPAWLVLVNFIGDEEMPGPQTAEEWHAAYRVARYVMGLPKRHVLTPYIIEVFPSVRDISAGRAAALQLAGKGG